MRKISSRCPQCHKKFVQMMHLNKNGKLVCECGRPRKYCSDECAHEYHLEWLRGYRRGNAEFNKKNTARMAAARQRQYEERIKPHYDRLKKLIANGDDEAALKFLVDIANKRLGQEDGRKEEK